MSKDKKEYWTSPSGITYEIGAPFPIGSDGSVKYVWEASTGYGNRLAFGTLDDAAERIQSANEALHPKLKTTGHK